MSCSLANCAGCCLNGTCQPGSTAAACGKNAASCVACTTGQVCKTDQTCGVDPESLWRVQPSAAVIAANDNGVAWDALGGAPDPFVSLYCPAGSAAPTASTPSVADSFMPTWATTVPAHCVMKARDLVSTGVGVAVWDEDVSDDDVIASKGAVPVTEAQLLAGSATGIGNGKGLVSLTLLLQRQ